MAFSRNSESLRSVLKKLGIGYSELLPSLIRDQSYREWSIALSNILFHNTANLKALQKPLKVTISSLHKDSSSELEESLALKLQKVLSPDQQGNEFPSSCLSFLLEDCPFARCLLSPHYCRLIECVCNIIQDQVSRPVLPSRQLKLCEVMKFILQILQYMRKDVTEQIENPDSFTHQNMITIANNCLVMLKRNKVFSAVVRNICGILLGHLLNYDPDDGSVAIVMMQMIFSRNLSKLSGTFSSLKTEYPFNVSREERTSYTVFLLKGLFSCTRSSAFLHGIKAENDCTLLHLSFEAILESLGMQAELQYHGFLVLKLWWRKTLWAVKSGYIEATQELYSEDGVFMKETLKVLLNHWDSPISGVSSIVLDIFTTIVHCVQKASKRLGQEQSPMLKKLLEDFMKLSSSVRGKYNFISVLVTELGAEIILEKYPDFLSGLTPFLSVNHLFPVISKTYRIIVAQIIKSGNKDTDLWNRFLVPGLMEALFHHNPSIRAHASAYWLPIHLKQVPNGYERLMKAVTECTLGQNVNKVEESLLTKVAISKVARSEGLITIQDIEGSVLDSSLSCFNDSIRAETFLLVCCNNKTSEEVSQLEMDLVETHLPMNMNSDSVVFRQQLVYCMKCFVERIRDSVIARNKKFKTAQGQTDNENYLNQCNSVLKSIVNVCTKSLHTSFSFQRKKTAIDIFSTLLSVFEPCIKVFPLVEILWMPENSQVLLDLLQDSIPEIRSLSLSLLVKFYPPPRLEVVKKYKELACNLCRSPRAQDNESGAIMLEYFIKKPRSCEAVSSTQMITEILLELEKEVVEIKTNILTASLRSPAHGWMLVLTRCLESVKDVENFKEFDEVVDRILDLIIDLTKYILKIVFGYFKKDLSTERGLKDDAGNKLGVSADFCEMTDRINKLVIENQTSANPDDILLTESHEAILASCWLCLLRGGSLLSVLSVLKSKSASNENALSKICNTFVLILVSCRHRGAIEGCFESFLKTCTTLFSSEFEHYQNIPCGIVSEVCDSLKDKNQGGSNVTRRSGGIPLVVEAVLVAELHSKSDELFHKTITTIIALSQQVYDLKPHEDDDKFDFPQIHGLYTLKHLFRNSQLGSRVLQYAVDVLRIATKCLSSPIWVARNAATHLFGAVVCRILGQKNIDGAYINSLENSASSAEFFSRFPELVDVIVVELSLSLPDGQLPISQYNKKCLLPKDGVRLILSMLSKLTYNRQDTCSTPVKLIEMLKVLLGSPVYSVRCLAAKSLLGLISETTALSFVMDSLQKLSCPTQDFAFKSNILHGRMVFIKLVTMAYAMSSSHAEAIFNNVLRLLTRTSLHPMVANECLEILSDFKDLLGDASALFSSYAKKQIDCVLKGDILHQVGMDMHANNLASLLLELSAKEESYTLFRNLMSSDHPSLQRAALDWLRKTSLEETDIHKVANLLIELILNADVSNCLGESTNILCECIEIWSVKYASSDLNISTCEKLYRLVVAWTSEGSPLSLQCSGLLLLSAMVVQIKFFVESGFADDFAKTTIFYWIDVVYLRTSRFKASEPLRLSASQSIEVAGCVVFKYLSDKDCKKYGKLVCATLSLMHDEQQEIRRPACSFVSKLISQKDESSSNRIVLHQNFATKVFLKLVFERFACDAVFSQCFWSPTAEHSPSKHGVLFDKEPFNLYEEPVELAEVAADIFLVSLENCKNDGLKQYINCKLEEVSFRTEQMFENGSKLNFVSQLSLVIYVKMLLRAASAIDAKTSAHIFGGLNEFLCRVWKDCTHERLKREATSVRELL